MSRSEVYFSVRTLYRKHEPNTLPSASRRGAHLIQTALVLLPLIVVLHRQSRVLRLGRKKIKHTDGQTDRQTDKAHELQKLLLDDGRIDGEIAQEGAFSAGGGADGGGWGF